jgi:CHAT domain-containing protein
MFGVYRKGNEPMPRVLHLSVARYDRNLPKQGEPLEFLLSIHEEGTGITWQQNITVNEETEQYFLKMTQELYLWSLNLAHTLPQTRDYVQQLGRRLYKTFIGSQGEKYLNSITPTAILLGVDETILNLPWELIRASRGPLAQRVPFGRLVTTRVIPHLGRDPLQEDTVVRILAVTNSTADLASSNAEVEALSKLEGQHGAFSIQVNVLSGKEATVARFAELLTASDYDILHFAGHASFDPSRPEASALLFADGNISADDVLKLSWKTPPYLVFNSACESGRAAGGKRLVSGGSHCNGLAAAFLAAGVYGYAGYYWPVTDVGATIFAQTFYSSLFMRENIGLAFLDARNRAIQELGEVGDLTGYSAVLFGDAASKHRRDLAMAV